MQHLVVVAATDHHRPLQGAVVVVVGGKGEGGAMVRHSYQQQVSPYQEDVSFVAILPTLQMPVQID